LARRMAIERINMKSAIMIAAVLASRPATKTPVRKRRFASGLFVFLSSATILFGMDNEATRRSLGGLAGVRVVVEPFAPEAEMQGLTITAVRTDAELRLRRAGIRVLTEEEFNESTGVPFLELAAAISVESSVRCGVSEFVNFRQNALLERDRRIFAFAAVTWSVETVNNACRPSAVARFVRDGFNDLVDQFVNAYLATNPKK